MTVEDTLTLVYHEHLYNQRENRIKEQWKLWDYYSGREDRVLKHLESALELTFKADDIEEFQKNYLNITKKIIDALAVIYREPAQRYFVSEFEKIRNNKKSEATLTNYYNSKLPVNINAKDRKAQRLGKLFNTSLTQVVFDRSVGRFDYITLPSHLYNIETDPENIYRLTKVSYPQFIKNKGKDEEVLVVWTDDKHYYLDANSNPLPVGDNKKMINPWGVIPFAKYMEEEHDDYWGNGQTDLVNANEQINFLLTDLINGGVIMQAWGTPVAINLGLAKQNEKGEITSREVRVGPKHPFVVENVTSDKLQPGLKYENANPLIKEVMDVIDWHINKLAKIKGINSHSILEKVIDSSGFSKIVDSIEQMELRRDSLESAKMFEQERFEITKKINNTLIDNGESKKYGLTRIDDKEIFSVDFAEIRLPISPEIQAQVDKFHLDRNIISILDIARRTNSDLTDDKLEEMIKTNKAINDRLVPDLAQVPIDNNINNITMRGQSQPHKSVDTQKKADATQ